MDKKTIAIVAALALVLIFYFQIMEFLGLYSPAKPLPPSQTQTDTTTVIDTGSLSMPAPSPSTAQTFEIPDSTRMAIAGQSDSLPVDTLIINTNRYKVTMTSFGGGPVSMLLKDFDYRNGQLIEMLPRVSSVTPEAVFAGGTFSTSQVNFKSSLPAGAHDATRDTLVVEYVFQREGGGQIVRRYQFYPDEYHYDLTLEVRERDKLGFEWQYNLVWNTPLGVTEPQPETDYETMEAAAMQGGSRVKLADFEDGQLNQSLSGNTLWAGVRSKYFAAVFIPKSREAESVFARGLTRRVTINNSAIDEKQIIAGITLPFGAEPAFKDSFTVFVGPLDYSLMSDYDVGLEDMLDIGTTPVIGWIIKPFAIAIIWLLPLMYKLTPNYGVVIILFALLVKLVTLPLSLKSYKSMNAMKELQPKIEELKKKHKNNPQAMNAEMMRMYKAHGVNPVSGCLPMLPQMPLFFALFSVFRSTILLRNAPFVGFISDLSIGASSFTDPYIILVVIMIVAQFLSQKLTMSSTQQGKMFLYIMPLMMGFFFYKFAAGLVLYWTCFSVFSVVDYFIFKRNKKNLEVKEA